MKILVNCSNLSSGGGYTVGLGVLNALFALETSDSFVVILPSDQQLYPVKNNSRIKIIRLTNFDNSVLGKFKLQNKLTSIVKNEKCDAILSLSNYAIKSKLPQSVMLHWPYAVYPEKEIWSNMSLINKLKRQYTFYKIKQLLPYANHLIVQTEVMKSRVEKHLKYKKSITVIPSAAGFTGDEINSNALDIITSLKKNNKKVFLCLNEYYEHKNLEILIPLAQKIKLNKSNFVFIITLESNSASSDFINQIKTLKLDDIIINIGRVKRSETRSLFKNCYALFFPSLIESFGIPMIEALETGLPIYTSDKDFAHAVCGKNAIYFDPHNTVDILNKMNLKSKISTYSSIESWDSITSKLLNTLK